MQSDSLRRFHAEQNEPKAGSTERRAELESQVAEFLSAGGEINRVPSTQMARPIGSFNFAVSERR